MISPSGNLHERQCRRRRRAWALAVLAGAFASILASGCQSSEQTQRESAEGAADALLLTCSGERPVAASEVLGDPAKQAFLRAPTPLDGCLEILGLQDLGRLRPDRVRKALGKTRVTSVRANDLSGSVELRAPDGTRSRMELERSKGDWYVAHPARPDPP